jgi:hypothetical protein
LPERRRTPRATRVYAETPFQRAGVGNGLFTGDNPPYGALLGYTLRKAAPSGSRVVVLVKDAAGKTIAEVNGPGAAGLNRTVWNLRRAPDTTQAIGRGAAGGRGAAQPDSAAAEGNEGRGGGRGNAPRPGPLVGPGTYTVQLARRNGQTVTNIGAAQRLRVVPLER